MTGTPSLPDTTDEVARAVRSLMPTMRRLAATAVVIITVAIVAAAVAAVLFLNSEADDKTRWKAAMFSVLGGGLIVVATFKWMIRRQESLVMPVLASAVGLTYAKDAKAFVNGLPKRLLPGRGIRAGEDYIRGALGAHAIQMSEVNVETGGKNSRTLFKGIVAQFPNRTAMPAFFVALEDKTRPGMFFGGDLSTEGLYHLRNVSGGGGRTYGVWTSWSKMDEPPALSAVVEILTGIESHVGYGAELYAATSNGEEMHIALSHRRNLFRIGGLFPNESEIFADVQTAMRDLLVPLTLAKALIGAEETAVAKVKGA
jgi:hypothetical protein